MTIIYGLRERGSEEIRYVGFTNRELPLRLRRHEYNARRGWPYGPTDWMQRAGVVEIVPLCECAPDDAHNVERQMVEALHGAGHRLTNRHLVPRQTGAAA